MEYTFNDFKERANDKTLTKWEMIGFPDSYRKGVESLIFNDISTKSNLDNANYILDIGCGCSQLVESLIINSNLKDQNLFLVDSKEMIENIDKNIFSPKIKLIYGRFPDKDVLSQLHKVSFDVILVYSVIQYVFIDQSIYNFIHECLKLLNSGGRLLLGDIPNFQTRERFLNSDKGKDFLLQSSLANNAINLQHENEERIDDSVVMSILIRFRQFGCETYLLPQPENLPFSNRREDILIIKR
jgi:2-polyprenyl-3-methyl-5-hydroxy-6-metoxy-1,4-benzoquinol methylase